MSLGFHCVSRPTLPHKSASGLSARLQFPRPLRIRRGPKVASSVAPVARRCAS